MRFFRTTIILFAVLLIAGFSYWYFEVKRSGEKREKEEKASLLFEDSEKKIVRLTVQEKGKPLIELRQEEFDKEEEKEEKEEKEEVWRILSPVETGGDATIIKSVVRSIKASKQEDVVWESLEKEDEYGLNDPEFSLRFFYEGEDAVRGIDFGIESIDKRKVFAKVLGEEKIYAVPASFRDSLKKRLFDLRDKRLTAFEAEDVTGVSLLSPSEVFVIKREGDDWYFVPERVKASKTRLDSYVGNLRWESFVEVEEERAAAADLKRYGLDTPRLIVRLEHSQEPPFRMLIGDSIKEGDAEFYYATRSTDNMVFQVKADLVERLSSTKFELKDRHIFDFDSDDVVGVVLENKEKSFSLEKEDEDWVLSDSGEKIKRGYSVSSIIRGISSAEYEEIEPIKRGESGYRETGIEDAPYRVALQFKEERAPVTVRLTEKNEKTNKLALTPDDGETVYYTGGYFISNFPKTKEELLD